MISILPTYHAVVILLRDNELIYEKCLSDCQNFMEREALWNGLSQSIWTDIIWIFDTRGHVTLHLISCHLLEVTVASCSVACQSAEIMASLCSVRVCVHVHMNNFSKTTRPRDMLFF